MKKILILILAIVPLFFLVQANVQAKPFLLTAEGVGENLDAAKASAMTALSQIILSKVTSEFSSDVKVHNDDVDRNMRSIKKVESAQIFKGVVFFEEFTNADGIRIKAGLDQKGVNDTIAFLKESLNVDYELLSLEQKREKLDITKKLSAFVSVFDDHLTQAHTNIHPWIKTKRIQLLKHLNQGRVYFVTEENTDYTVFIDGNTIENGRFLAEGEYDFSAKAKNYRTVRGAFFVSSGEVVKVKLPFIKVVANKTINLIIPDKFSFLEEDVQDALSDLGITLNSKAKNRLVIKVKDSSVEVDGYFSHRLKVRVEAYKNDERIKKVSLKKTFIVEQGESSKVERTINTLAIKGIIGLMSRIDLNDFFSN